MSTHHVPNRISSPASSSTNRRASRNWRGWGVEALESRRLLSTFTVSNLDASGAGSLRWAILSANARPGPDVVDFDVAGAIHVGHKPLPAVVDAVTIDGTTAPSYAGAPVVTIDFKGSGGLVFNAGSEGSTLQGLSVVRSKAAGVTLNASRITVRDNYIGLLVDGSTVAGNRGDGVRINASSHDNVIGRVDPVSGVSFYDASSVSMQPVSGWQGIREGATAGEYLITGTSGSDGLLYIGPISGVGGTSYSVNYPGASSTSVYGPDLLPNGSIRLVGSYRSPNDDVVHGFLYEGPLDQLSVAANYRTIDYADETFNYIHSTMGGLAVGNTDGPQGGLPLGTGHALLYDVSQGALLPNIVYPGSTSTTAYGIWHNGEASYTIVGGYSMLAGSGGTIGRGYMVDYDSLTGTYSHWTSFDYPNPLLGQDFITHFEGISGVEKGVYTLSADSVQSGSSNPAQGSWVSVRRNPDGTFGEPVWVDLADPNVDARTNISSSNSVAGNQVVGITIGEAGAHSFQATINIEFQLSNVISGNGGEGVGVYGSHGNRIGMNYIGTDASGSFRRSNGGNGVRLTAGASRNTIGGQATDGNDPTAGVFARPPMGNLISGNRSNGVLIDRGASRNLLSGNFIGTTATGNAALGNRLDGVAIDRAHGNELIGCTFQQSPFVFYNVLSGNGGNGLRVTNADDTLVQANFMGVGANNSTIVANGGDGLLVSGSSRNTHVGGVIPLGNVISGNNRNGIEVRDTASGFLSFNTFAGLFAFGDAAPNRRSGILITSSGGNNTIRTSIVSGNLGHGIELSGKATGVQITETAIGANSDIQTALPNGGSGVLIAGRAHGNAIGGFQPSIEPQTTISSNGRYGIEVVGSARDNVVFHTNIGTNAQGTAALGNALGGILLGHGTRSTTIGGPAGAFRNQIRNNGGDGLTIQSSRDNAISGNDVVANRGYGLRASGNSSGTVIADNVITENDQGDVDLTNSTGVVYIP